MSFVRWAGPLLLVLACRDSTGPAPDSLGARLSAWVPDSSAVLAHERVSPSLAWHLVARDTSGWRLLWEQAFEGWRPLPPRPTVNFDSSMVLLAVAAERDDVRLDSLVTFRLGTRVYLTKCWRVRGVGAPSEPVGFGQFVRIPRASLAATHTTAIDACW